jgi:hypothetical protein
MADEWDLPASAGSALAADPDDQVPDEPWFLKKGRSAPPVRDEWDAPVAKPDTFRKIKNTGPDVAAQLAAEAAALQKDAPRSLADRARDSAAGIANTVKGGVRAVAAAKDRGFLNTLEDPTHRREFERGLSDIITLGYAEKLGNAVDPSFAATAQPDAEAAPDDRKLGQLVGMASPGVGTYAAKSAGKVLAPVLGDIQAGTVAGRAAVGAAKSVAGYEATAPLTAALSASSEGHRGQAALDAAIDPVGFASSAVAGGLAPVAGGAIENSKGARARRFIAESGGGAKVGPLTPGTGGVFDEELSGVPASDRGVGQAAKIGARQIHDTIEQQFLEENGFPYRQGPAVVKEADRALRDTKASARSEARAIALAHRDDLAAAHHAVRTETTERAQQILDDIAETHKFETSLPYKALKSIIDSKPESIAPRDVTPIVTSMQDAVNDLETAPHVRAQLEQQLKILDNYRDPQTGAVMVPERQLNGLRRTLMRSAKVGMSDAPGEAEAPLRRAAFIAKQMVDEGPYKELNDLYATGTAKRDEARQAVGLPGKPSKSAAADQKRLVSSLRRSVTDETAIPGPAPAADVSDLRDRLAAPDAAKEAALAKIRGDLSKAEAQRAAVAQHVTTAQAAAAPDRALLGLNDKIGTRKTDVNQTRLALERQVGESATSGGNPADINAFRAAHPELTRATDLAPLARARADLSFHVKPHVGGLMDRVMGGAALPALAYGMVTHPIATTLGLAAENKTAIEGRLLAGMAPALRSGTPGLTIGRTAGPAGAAQASDRAIAQLIQGASAGEDPAELQKRAAAWGIDPAYASSVIAKFSPQQQVAP